MILERSKRRQILSLVFILKCVSKKLLIKMIPRSRKDPDRKCSFFRSPKFSKLYAKRPKFKTQRFKANVQDYSVVRINPEINMIFVRSSREGKSITWRSHAVVEYQSRHRLTIITSRKNSFRLFPRFWWLWFYYFTFQDRRSHTAFLRQPQLSFILRAFYFVSKYLATGKCLKYYIPGILKLF